MRMRIHYISWSFILFITLIMSGCFTGGPTDVTYSLQRNKLIAGIGAASGTVRFEFLSGVLHIMASGLPALTATQEYHPVVSLIDGDKVNLGAFEIDAGGDGEVEAVFTESLHHISAISIERHDEDEAIETETVILSVVVQTTTDATTPSEPTPEHGH